MAIKVDEARCIGCGSCVILCPEEALDISPSFIAEVDSTICTECLTCLDCCSHDALEAV